MGFFSVSTVKGLVALQIFCVLMNGCFDFTNSTRFEMGLEEEDASPQPVRKLVAVEGVIYCKSCKFQGVDTLLGASPLPEGKTDKNGYFFIHTPKVTSYGAHKCKVLLVLSTLDTCKNMTDLNGGATGARLRFNKVLMGQIPVALYSSGPLAFGPTNATSCPSSP